MARKIDACLAAGVNVLIYDWYWYRGRPFLENGINAFMKAPNFERIKFAIMWANHDIDDLWDKTVPVKCRDKKGYRNIRCSAGGTDLEEFKTKLVPRWIEYFKKPNYYKINGKPLFQIFSPVGLAERFGSMENFKEAMSYFENETKKAGFPGIEIMPTSSILPKNPSSKDTDTDYVKKMRQCLDFYQSKNWKSVFAYNWLELGIKFEGGSYYQDYEGRKDIDYKEWGDLAYDKFAQKKKDYPDTVIFPNVTCGWDCNSRFKHLF